MEKKDAEKILNDAQFAFPMIGAVPTGEFQTTLQGKVPRMMVAVNSGMTLRDYFAAKAMAVIGQDRFIQTPKFVTDRDPENGGDMVELSDDVIHHSAALCYKIADAMINARSL